MEDELRMKVRSEVFRIVSSSCPSCSLLVRREERSWDVEKGGLEAWVYECFSLVPAPVF